MTVIKKKAWPGIFEKMLSGEKNFDLRLADFNIKVGDTLVLEEYNPETKKYTGRKLTKKVGYVLHFKLDSFGQKEGIIKKGLYAIQLIEGSFSIKQAQQMVDAWIKSLGSRYFDKLTQMAQLTEEVGEVARVISRTYGEQSFKKGEKEDLGDELADVLFALICIANSTGVDLTEKFENNLDKKTKRDKRRHARNQKLKI